MDTKNNNNQSSLVIKRQVQVEAISKAVYLITNLFEDSEPLKMSLRRVSVECVESTNKKDSFIRLSSLVKLSHEIGLVTKMNADLLLRVVEDQISGIDKKVEAEEVSIENVLLAEEQVVAEKVVELVPIYNKEEVELVVADKVEKKVTPSITINNNTQNIKTINNISMDIGSRRKRILEIVKARGAVTINEFIEAIKGCSSKTIQRELTSLVLSGTLKKTGERRWSKYSLK